MISGCVARPFEINQVWRSKAFLVQLQTCLCSPLVFRTCCFCKKQGLASAATSSTHSQTLWAFFRLREPAELDFFFFFSPIHTHGLSLAFGSGPLQCLHVK